MESASPITLVVDVLVAGLAAISLLVEATASSIIPSAPSRLLETEPMAQTARLIPTIIATTR